MAFIFYFIVILVSAASVMFGLDLVTSPLPPSVNVPIGRVAQAPPPVKQAHKATKRIAGNRDLSPVYPAAPGAHKDKTAQAAPDSAAPDAAPKTSPETAPKQASSEEWLPPAPPLKQSASAPPPDDKQVATETASNAQPVAAQLASAQSAPHCNVAACSAAFRSFRASDCSYQPTEGPRQICTRSAGATAAAAPPRRWRAERTARNPGRALNARDRHEVDAITRIVQRMTPGQRGDIAVQDSQGRIIIVHPEGASAYGDDYR